MELQLDHLINGNFPAIKCATTDTRKAQAFMVDSLKRLNRKVTLWDGIRGIYSDSGSRISSDKLKHHEHALNWALNELGPGEVIIFRNLNLFFGAKTIDLVDHCIDQFESNGRIMILLSRSLDLPPILKKVFVKYNFELPSIDDHRKMIEDFVKRTEKAVKQKLVHIKEHHILAAAEAMQGLGHLDSANVLAATLTSTAKLDTEIIYDLKGRIFEDFAALKYLKPTERFEDLHGLKWLDTYFLNSIKNRKSRGMAIIGVPGVGKTHWLKAAGNATGYPIYWLEIGRLFEKYVGESDKRVDELIQILNRMKKFILGIDELEKAFSFTASGGGGTEGDSGVGMRIFRKILQWLSERAEEDDIYVIATINSTGNLPPEFWRKGRFDTVAYIDYLNAEDNGKILKMYADKYGLQVQNPPDLTHWTPAEIKGLVLDAIIQQCPDLTTAAERYVNLQWETEQDAIQRVRETGEKYCKLSAQNWEKWDSQDDGRIVNLSDDISFR